MTRRGFLASILGAFGLGGLFRAWSNHRGWCEGPTGAFTCGMCGASYHPERDHPGVCPVPLFCVSCVRRSPRGVTYLYAEGSRVRWTSIREHLPPDAFEGVIYYHGGQFQRFPVSPVAPVGAEKYGRVWPDRRQ